MHIIVFAALFLLVASCDDKEKPVPLLQGDKPRPLLRTETLANDLFIVVAVVPYGFQKMQSLAVAEDGTQGRSTFVAPSSMGLKRGDVIKVQRQCYQAKETYSTKGSGFTATEACTDLVTPYSAPTAEASQKTGP